MLYTHPHIYILEVDVYPNSTTIFYQFTIFESNNGLVVQSYHFDIAHNNNTTVARHFDRCAKHNPAQFSGMEISILNFIHAPPTSRASQDLRDIEEKRWIHRLASVVPRGLNLLDKGMSIVTNICLIKLIHPAIIHSGQSEHDY